MSTLQTQSSHKLQLAKFQNKYHYLKPSQLYQAINRKQKVSSLKQNHRKIKLSIRTFSIPMQNNL